jgi:hypothetical protein
MTRLLPSPALWPGLLAVFEARSQNIDLFPAFLEQRGRGGVTRLREIAAGVNPRSAATITLRPEWPAPLGDRSFHSLIGIGTASRLRGFHRHDDSYIIYRIGMAVPGEKPMSRAIYAYWPGHALLLLTESSTQHYPVR